MILGLATALDAPKSISRIKQVRLHIHTKAHIAYSLFCCVLFFRGVAEAASAHVHDGPRIRCGCGVDLEWLSYLQW